MKRLLFLLCVCGMISSVNAQDKNKFRFGKVSLEDFNVVSPDSSADAIVIADIGYSDFEAQAHQQAFAITFKRQRRVKIVNKNGIDAATVIVPLYTNDKSTERLDNLKAYTYNVEDGKVKEVKMESSAVVAERHSKNVIYKKFTLPAVKEGSIIEYSYIVTSDFVFNLQPWEFQGQYPVLLSEYNVAIPEFFDYVVISQGYQPITANKLEPTQANYVFREESRIDPGLQGGRVAGSNFDLKGVLYKNQWTAKNVPALKLEPFTSTLNNHISKIEFQLSEIRYPNSIPKKVMGNWETMNKELLSSEYFGYNLTTANNWMDDDVKAFEKITDKKQRAKAAFEFIRNNFTCTSEYGKYLTTTLKDAYKKKGGNVADVNLLLVSMLNHLKLDASPVLLSTRKFGEVNQLYPLLDKYSYVICKLDIDSTSYLLDATKPKLGFGKLPYECYNGYARVINPKKSSGLFLSADSIAENQISTVFITKGSKGSMSGAFTTTYGDAQSYSIRDEIAKSSKEEYFKHVKKSFAMEVELEKSEIENQQQYEEPLVTKSDFTFSLGNDDVIYFNPILKDAYKTNPFKSAERFYPVEMPYVMNEVYVLNMEVPEGYAIDELPKSTRVKYNEDEGLFEYILQESSGMIQLRCRVQLNKAVFQPDEYENLRSFFAYIVGKQNEQIVFKKVK